MGRNLYGGLKADALEQRSLLKNYQDSLLIVYNFLAATNSFVLDPD